MRRQARHRKPDQDQKVATLMNAGARKYRTIKSNIRCAVNSKMNTKDLAVMLRKKLDNMTTYVANQVMDPRKRGKGRRLESTGSKEFKSGSE